MIDALHAFGLEELLAAPVSPNGHAMGACANCGEPVALRKGSIRLWCHRPDCRKAANAQRQKDLRERRKIRQ